MLAIQRDPRRRLTFALPGELVKAPQSELGARTTDGFAMLEDANGERVVTRTCRRADHAGARTCRGGGYGRPEVRADHAGGEGGPTVHVLWRTQLLAPRPVRRPHQSELRADVQGPDRPPPKRASRTHVL